MGDCETDGFEATDDEGAMATIWNVCPGRKINICHTPGPGAEEEDSRGREGETEIENLNFPPG